MAIVPCSQPTQKMKLASLPRQTGYSYHVSNSPCGVLGVVVQSLLYGTKAVCQKGLVLSNQLHNRVENLADVSTRCSGLLQGEAVCHLQCLPNTIDVIRRQPRFAHSYACRFGPL